MNSTDAENNVRRAGLLSAILTHGGPATTVHASVCSATHVTPRELPSTKAVILKLVEELDAADVRYCHWKSNARVADTLAGMEDIDLLVDRRHAELFQTVLLATGFKLAQSYSGIGHPAVFNALALDDATADLVHLHAHYQIVSGDSLVKNYRFPLEDLLLAHTRTVHGVKVPAAEVDLLLFLLRVALKHTSLIEILKVNLHYSKVIAELAWLLKTADVKETQALLEQWLPMVEPSLLQELLQAAADDGAVLRRMILGWRVAWRLREFRRVDVFRAFLSRQWRLVWYVISRCQRRRDFVPLTGGLIVALVGPKASGKSTVGAQLVVRLGRHLVVTRIHAGKPPATSLSALPRLFVPLARKLMPHERLGEYEKPERRLAKVFSLFYVVRMFLLAHDRRKLLFRALRAATAGEIVVSDRYPSETVRAIDSSCFDEEAQVGCPSAFKRWFMRQERERYRGLPKPALVLRLVTSLDVAVRRDAEREKLGGPDAEAVRRRWDLEILCGVPRRAGRSH